MSYETILDKIKQRKFSPVYFFHGEESWFIDQLADAIEANALTESERSFNLTILYGKDADARTVIDSARRYPMMADRTLVLLREAQDMKTLGDLLPYLEKPTPSTVLVISHKNKKIDTRTKFGKSILSQSENFEAKPLYDNQIPDWISTYVKTKGQKIQGDAAFLLADSLGTDLGKVANELDKLLLTVQKGEEITIPLIQKVISDSRVFSVFDLQKALGARDPHKTRRIVLSFIVNQKEAPLPVLISSLYGFFSKLYQLSFMHGQADTACVEALQLRSSYFLKDYRAASGKFNRAQLEQIIHLLSIYDLRSKGVNNDSADYEALLTELTWKILHI